MRRRIVPEFNDEWVAIERGLDDAALDSSAATVDEAHFAKTRERCRFDVFVDNRRNVPGCERVEIELAFDRNSDWGQIWIFLHPIRFGQRFHCTGVTPF